MSMDKDISGIVKKQREYFAAGATLDVQGRIAALKRLPGLLSANI